jgi:hypothetical protein
MQLEKDLERLLRRERPPAGFAARVMQRVEQEERTRPSAHAPWWRAAAAAVLLTLGGGAWITHNQIERREQDQVRINIERQQGERAKAEVLFALRIASSKMHAAREHVRELGTH